MYRLYNTFSLICNIGDSASEDNYIILILFYVLLLTGFAASFERTV